MTLIGANWSPSPLSANAVLQAQLLVCRPSPKGEDGQKHLCGTMPFVPQFSGTEANLVRGCLQELQSFVEHCLVLPLRKLVHSGGTPDEITSIIRRCGDIERDIAAGLGTSSPPPPVCIDDLENRLLKLAIVHKRKSLAVWIEEQRRRTFHPQMVDTLSAQLKPYQDLMKEFWFENTPTERMPQLTDFVSLQAALEVLGDPLTPLERQFDEKFNILQAPKLLLRDLAYYRGHCELRGASLVVAYLDIDNFKKNFNSRYGETVVDRNVLPRFMMAIEALVFGRGYAYRYGGDEYAIILPGLGQSAAVNALDELRLRVKELKYIDVAAVTTVSIGLIVVDPDCFLTNAEIEHKAEEAKNMAKSEGRDRIAEYVISGSGVSCSVVRPKK